MDLETRLLIERAIGILEAMSVGAEPGMQQALTIAVQMFDTALKKAPVTIGEKR